MATLFAENNFSSLNDIVNKTFKEKHYDRGKIVEHILRVNFTQLTYITS